MTGNEWPKAAANKTPLMPSLRRWKALGLRSEPRARAGRVGRLFGDQRDLVSHHCGLTLSIAASASPF
jgi:hypothetical protein